MIKSFRHKGIRRFFEQGSTRGINPAHATKLNVQLTALNVAKGPQDMSPARLALACVKRRYGRFMVRHRKRKLALDVWV